MDFDQLHCLCSLGIVILMLTSYKDLGLHLYCESVSAGPYSNEVEAHENIQNVAHPTKPVSRKRSSRTLTNGDGSDSDSDNEEYNRSPKSAKSPCQSSDENEEVC